METFLKTRIGLFGLSAPAFVIMLMAFGIPTVQLFLISLSAPSFSLVNYGAFFAQSANFIVLIQTVKISAVVTAICLVIGYPAAYLIAAAPKRLGIALMVLVFVPWLTSGLVRTYAWTVILGDHGVINELLLNLELISSPLTLLYNRLAVYIGMVHIMLPMMILPLLSVMQGIDRSLVAAARSMGARPFVAFWRVFFPLSLPGVRSGTVLVFVGCLGFYVTPQALGGLADAMLSNFIVAQFSSSLDLARTAASAFVLLAIALVILSIFGLDLSGTQSLAVQPASGSRQSRLPAFSMTKRFLNNLIAPYREKRWFAELYEPGRASFLSGVACPTFVVVVMTFLLFPGIIVVIMSFNEGAFLQFPPSGVSLQWYRSFLEDPSWIGAFWTSIQIGLAVTILSTIIGTLAAHGLSRTSSRLRSFLILVLLTPITVPVIVVGVAAYLGLTILGLIGSKTGIVLAHSIGAIAYVVVIVSATMASFDRRLELAAKSMRAGPIRTFMRVTLPLIRPGIIGGALFAFIASFDEVVITSFVAGFSIQTLPLKMLENIRQQIDPTIAAVGSLLTLAPILWLIVFYMIWWRPRRAFGATLMQPIN
ncbi:ABC transporter permease [Bradyrhizobium sp. CCBAU 21362]|uniref:ABC transporter permease subunit n=1 Tax=Bradyrhizobium sp. CCBAU 21362 TaxID=1325082 RepID=UPI0023061E33|nr:ABC transporter permease subunit [Bradyrhizobium sp. CCBAU 21362]MDA9537042.1 ABC transporter permease [Bradyrhizobium sp. CCBAU 21362]